jgi:hypothetical protein
MRCQDKDSGGALVLNPIGGCIDRPVDAPRRINLKPEDIRQGKHSHIAGGLGELDVQITTVFCPYRTDLAGRKRLAG